MTTDPELLNSVRIASPCHESWDGMAGDNRVRFCGSCRLNVYNLSEMSAPDAAALVRNAEGRLCVRFFQRADGTLLTQDCPKGLRALRLRLASVAAAFVGAVAMLLGGCQRVWRPPTRATLMGDVAAASRPAGGSRGPSTSSPAAPTMGKPSLGETRPADPPLRLMGEVVAPTRAAPSDAPPR